MIQLTEKMRPAANDNNQIYHAEAERELCIVAQRIVQARKKTGITLKDLQQRLKERDVDVGYTSLIRWEKGETVPNAYQLLAICNALNIPDAYSYFMNTAATLNEVGLQKVEDYKNDLIASGHYKPVVITRKKAVKYIEMPVSTLAASAGTGEFLDGENIELMRFPESSVPAGADFAVRVNGDSMEPVYLDHQLAWVQVCNELQPGEVGIFVLDGEGYIKAYDEQEPGEDERDDYTDSNGNVHSKPVLISYNRKYAPRVVLPSNSFKICGRVLN